MFRHIDVIERNKQPGSLGLSNELDIVIYKDNREIYHDLDHIYSEYIQPMNHFTKLMVDHKAFYKYFPLL